MDPVMTWFGEPWERPLDADERSPVPIGDRCKRCTQAIVATDRGLMIPQFGAETSGAWHLVCVLEALGARRRVAPVEPPEEALS
jgi:hypothetical protein